MEQSKNRKVRLSKETRAELIDRVGQGIYEFQQAADAVDDAAAFILRLNPTDHRCLTMLVMRGPMTVGRLADGAFVSAGAMTASVDRLERAGFVIRVRDEEDRRRVVVEATPEARSKAFALSTPLAEESERLLRGHGDEHLRRFAELLRALTDLQVAYAERLRALAPPVGGIGAIRAVVEQAAASLKEAKAELKAQARLLREELGGSPRSER